MFIEFILGVNAIMWLIQVIFSFKGYQEMCYYKQKYKNADYKSDIFFKYISDNLKGKASQEVFDDLIKRSK